MELSVLANMHSRHLGDRTKTASKKDAEASQKGKTEVEAPNFHFPGKRERPASTSLAGLSYLTNSNTVKLAFLTYLVSTVRLVRRIERVPSRFLPRRAPVAQIHRRLIQHRIKPGTICISNARRDQRAATTNSLSVQGSSGGGQPSFLRCG